MFRIMFGLQTRMYVRVHVRALASAVRFALGVVSTRYPKALYVSVLLPALGFACVALCGCPLHAATVPVMQSVGFHLAFAAAVVAVARLALGHQAVGHTTTCHHSGCIFDDWT